jgi:hypothetical protein
MAYKKDRISITARALSQTTIDQLEKIGRLFPYILPFLEIVSAGFSYYLNYKQEEMNDFTAYLIDHPEVFKPADFKNKDLLSGLYVALDAYFQLRVEDKQYVAKNILLAYGKTLEKPFFPLERYYDTLNKISVESLKFLVIYQQYILPKIIQDAERKYEEGKFPKPPVGEDRQFWVNKFTLESSIYDHAVKWVDEKSELEFRKMNIKGPLEVIKMKYQQEKRDDLLEIISELQQLDIINVSVGGIGQIGGSGDTAYRFTRYGRNFIDFIPSEQKNTATPN